MLFTFGVAREQLTRQQLFFLLVTTAKEKCLFSRKTVKSFVKKLCVSVLKLLSSFWVSLKSFERTRNGLNRSSKTSLERWSPRNINKLVNKPFRFRFLKFGPNKGFSKSPGLLTSSSSSYQYGNSILRSELTKSRRCSALVIMLCVEIKRVLDSKIIGSWIQKKHRRPRRPLISQTFHKPQLSFSLCHSLQVDAWSLELVIVRSGDVELHPGPDDSFNDDISGSNESGTSSRVTGTRLQV